MKDKISKISDIGKGWLSEYTPFLFGTIIEQVCPDKKAPFEPRGWNNEFLKKGRLSICDLYFLLLIAPTEGDWVVVKKDLLRWLHRFRGESRSILLTAARHWVCPLPSFKTTVLGDDKIEKRIFITVGQMIFADGKIETMPCANRKKIKSIQIAAWHLLCQVAGFNHKMVWRD